MRFSIIVPAYNAEGHIRKALDSIKSQTFKDYECIVVCDSCVDNTEQIAQSYGFKTVAVDFHNDGLSRSKGLDLAKGEYVLFMDDDDWWLHEYVLEQIDRKLRGEDILIFSFIFKGNGYADPKSMGGKPWIAVWCKCWKRSFIGSTRFPCVEAVSDWFFHQEMFAKNPSVTYWDMPMYYYNFLRRGSISDKRQRGETI